MPVEDKNAWVWIIVAVAALLLLGTFGMGGYGMMGLGMGFGLTFMLLFWGALVWVVIALVNSAQTGKEDPATTLKRRYAAGEISRKRYGEMRRALK